MDNARGMCSETISYFDGLMIFSGIRKDPAIISFEKLLHSIDKDEDKRDPREILINWSGFVSTFIQYNNGRTFFMYVTELVLYDENVFTIAAECGKYDNNSLVSAMVFSDIKRLAMISDFDIPFLALYVSDILWQSDMMDCARLIEIGVRAIGEVKQINFDLDTNTMPYGLLERQKNEDIVDFVMKNGAGIMARHRFFYWRRGEGLVPAIHPDTVQSSDLSGYESERRIVSENTLRFVEGRGANNVLLYGDRGTGKSATVKAVCNDYHDRHLRLVEVRKQDLSEIPLILETLSKRGMYFILFIDDLSFEYQDDEFTMLKALLEGGIDVKPDNVAVYATSNRRHFVKERFSDRPTGEALIAGKASGDVREFDTMQEQLSLADRFGVTVVFTAPSQDEFIRIAEFLAEKRGLFSGEDGPRKAFDRQTFREQAIKWERWFNGRSPRTAQQFVEWAAGGSDFPWQ